MKVLNISVGDRVELKKPHPCGSKLFDIIRTGSDVRIKCTGCGRDMLFDRIKFEKAVKRIVSKKSES